MLVGKRFIHCLKMSKCVCVILYINKGLNFDLLVLFEWHTAQLDTTVFQNQT